MRLANYLQHEEITYADFAGRLGVSSEAVRLWATGKRIPGRKLMGAIRRATAGQVKPDDFYAKTASAAE
jgi:DNA-binding transcriptional regulator YdaS (Cro superfamily)